MLAGGQTYADTLLSFGKLFGSRHESFGFSISIFEPSPVRYQPVYVAPAPPPCPWIVAPTYVPPPPGWAQPVVIERPVMVPTPVYIERPVMIHQPVFVQRPVVVQRPVYVQRPVVMTPGWGTPNYGRPHSVAPTYYPGQRVVRPGHWVYQPMPSRGGAVRYQQVYVND
jgi:hypothetical protein